MMIHCPRCGITNNDYSRFCKSCGNQLKIDVKQLYAGFGSRVAAYLIDFILIFFWMLILDLLFFNEEQFENLWYVLGGVSSLLYFALFEALSQGATLGKKVLGIRVTDLQFQYPGWGRSLGRNLVKSLFGMTGLCLIAYLLPLFTSRKQAFHDLLAGTVVVTKQALESGWVRQAPEVPGENTGTTNLPSPALHIDINNCQKVKPEQETQPQTKQETKKDTKKDAQGRIIDV